MTSSPNVFGTQLSPTQRQYLLIGHSLVPFVINFVLNGVIGLLAFRGVDVIPTWGLSSSAVADTVGTCFLLPAISCLIVTPIVRYHTRTGMVAPIPSENEFPAWLRLLQCRVHQRALLFGGACLLLLGGIVFAGYALIDLPALPKRPFIWFKALSSGVFGAMITPVIAFVALADVRQAED